LKEIAKNEDIKIENIKPEQVQSWVKNDHNFKEKLELDGNFNQFFSQLVISSLKPLKQVAQAENIPIQDLTIKQLINWFEHESQQNLGQD
jgi:hypothetical protein